LGYGRPYLGLFGPVDDLQTQYSHEFRVARLEIIDWPEKTEVGPPVTQAPAPAPAPKPATSKAPFEDDGQLPF
jgi:hypothetical protein